MWRAATQAAAGVAVRGRAYLTDHPAEVYLEAGRCGDAVRLRGEGMR
jgi:hypothetical protein